MKGAGDVDECNLATSEVNARTFLGGPTTQDHNIRHRNASPQELCCASSAKAVCSDLQRFEIQRLRELLQVRQERCVGQAERRIIVIQPDEAM